METTGRETLKQRIARIDAEVDGLLAESRRRSNRLFMWIVPGAAVTVAVILLIEKLFQPLL